MEVSLEINKVSWECECCGHENTDFLKETTEPLCGGCDKVFEWDQVHVDVVTIIGGEETTVCFGELWLIEEKLINEVDELSKENVSAKLFTNPIPDGWVAAYWGTFGEYVPVKFPE